MKRPKVQTGLGDKITCFRVYHEILWERLGLKAAEREAMNNQKIITRTSQM